MMTTFVRAVDAARAETARERAGFARARKAENQYARRLRDVARYIDDIVRAFVTNEGDVSAAEPLLRVALQRYSQAIEPWARATGARMLADVSRRDEAVWARLSKTMSRALRDEIQTAPTGEALRALLAEQVDLITSLPLDAAQRVHELTLAGLETSTRANVIAEQVLATGHVTRNRANMIARTEVARTASTLVEVRATHVGSEGYIWRSSEDADVRNADGNPVGSHRKLNGQFIRWDSPPVASTDGVTRAHAGQIYNCRCYPEPVIPDVLN